MSAYHRHYSSLAAAEAAGEVDGGSENHWAGQTTRLVNCNCGGVWAVAVNQFGHPWTGWPDCPKQKETCKKGW